MKAHSLHTIVSIFTIEKASAYQAHPWQKSLAGVFAATSAPCLETTDPLACHQMNWLLRSCLARRCRWARFFNQDNQPI